MKQEGRRLSLLTPGFSQSPLHVMIYTPLWGEARSIPLTRSTTQNTLRYLKLFEPVTWTKRPTPGLTGEGSQS